MIRQKQSRRLAGVIIFIIVVVISGFALAATGNMRNPFNVISEITGVANANGMERPSGERGAPPSGSFGRAERGGVEGGMEGRGGGESAAIQWSRLGGVLFNLWVFAAAAAIVMVIGRPIGLLIKQLRRGRRPIPAYT